MIAKSPVPVVPSMMPKDGIAQEHVDRRPTDAERDYVRARARDAARAIFEAERRQITGARNEVES